MDHSYEEIRSVIIDILAGREETRFNFRQGVIMIGADDANDEFPFFGVTTYGKRIIEGADPSTVYPLLQEAVCAK